MTHIRHASRASKRSVGLSDWLKEQSTEHLHAMRKSVIGDMRAAIDEELQRRSD